MNGAILQIGNQLLCRNGDNWDGSNGADGNTCIAPTEGTPNNSWRQYRFKADTAATAPFNSMARLVMDSGDEVVYARLYWSARADNSTDASSDAAGQIQIKGPLSTSYTLLTAADEDHGNSGYDYGASVDVTQYVTDNRDGDYYVGDIVSQSGGKGIYASWQLIVVVKNAARSLKNIAIYDGFRSIYNQTVSSDATNFITPTGTKPFNASLFVYAGETDDSYGDSTRLQDGTGTWKNLTDGQNDSSDVMNASVSSPDYPGGYRSNDSTMANPNFRNVLGVDIDKLVINDKEDSSQQILSNSQTATKIEISSFKGSYASADQYSLNMFAFETEVFVPEFCYDYAYKQQGKYFTEKNAGDEDPRLVGDVVNNEPVEVTIYLKSLVESAITISNMKIHVSDINNSQADLMTSSVRLAKMGNLYPVAPSYTTNSIGEKDYINDVEIGTLEQNEYFYVYYTVNPKTTDLDMPITVEASYNLNLESVSVPYNLKLSKDIPLCDDGSYDYNPVTGIFNVVHNNYYNAATQYYNLPTQVTSRAGDFAVIATDEDDNDLLKSVNTIVAVELIDAAAFQTTDASCREMESAISERVWLTFDDNASRVIFNGPALQSLLGINNTHTTAAEFYAEARENAAFRVSYNEIAEHNGTIVDHTLQADGTYIINNFSELVQTITSCNEPVLYPTNPGVATTSSVADACGAATSNGAISKIQYQSCMECLYGYNVRFVCSRDNFAIRPEAFLIKINDQDQNNSTNKLRLTGTDNISGTTSVDSPTPETQLAAGYQYNLEINATNHLTNAASVGYTKVFEVDSTTDLLEYEWSPTSTLTGCNDINDTPVDFRIVDGSVLDLNSSLDQVGEYILSMKDETWTTVDSSPTAMAHHIAPFFLSPNKLDCIDNSSNTKSEIAITANATPLNGCFINSDHDSSSATALEYRDYPVEFHPYMFDLTGINQTVGLANQEVNASSYVYMADMSIPEDENMSYHLNGIIRAAGKNNSSLSNFVNNCYAKPLDIDLDISVMNLPVAYQYRFHSRNSNGVDINTQNGDLVNGTIINVTTADFPKDMNGTADTIANLNYNRTNNVVVNPEAVTYNSYDVNCTNSIDDCTFLADLTTKTTTGVKDLNSSISVNHYYARTNSPRSRFVTNPGNAFIYYEIYCDILTPTPNGSQCNKSLLPDGNTSKITDNPRWFKNEDHNVTGYGNVGIVTQKGATRISTSTLDNTTVGQTVAPLLYNESRGYPYKATMQNAAPRFLIYNRYDTTNIRTQNEFEVEFVNSNTNWAGENNGAHTTGDTASSKTNRRSMW